MSISGIGGGIDNSYATSSTGSQTLQQLESLASSGSSGSAQAVQLLQSLPKGEAHQLMQEMRQQDPSAAQSIHTAFEQQLQQQGQSGMGIVA